LGIGATIGPLIGSKLGTRQSFAASTLATCPTFAAFGWFNHVLYAFI
jgi:hypothetical protein